jgi:polyisoprenyl-phosphate glycosyltransferase
MTEAIPARPLISIVTPVYNEQESLADCIEQVRRLFSGPAAPLADCRYEHIFADNASTDQTVPMLRRFAAEDKNIKVILNARNFGALRSVFNALRACSGDATVVLLPADLQDPPSLIPEFVKYWRQGYKSVYGIRTQRQEGLVMTVLRRGFYMMQNRFASFTIPENVGEFYLIDKVVLKALCAQDDYYPNIRGMIPYCGFPSRGIEYVWQKRLKGKSKNNYFSLIDHALNAIISFGTAPVRFALLVGFLIAFLSLLFSLYIVIDTLFFAQSAPSGIPLLASGMFFFGGVLLGFMGVLGEYIIAIHGQVRKRPLVVEAERINFD